MGNGFFGKILWIDLSDETFKEENLSESIYRQYLGGYGLGCKLIYENTPIKFDPLGSDSILGFFPGLVTGTVTPFSGRYMVAGKSPLTGTWGDANSGGTFGPEIKKCGYDAIIFKGIAEKPKYVSIISDEKQIHDASDIWGKDVIEAEEKLKKKYGKYIKTAGIGQAGEKLSLISGIVNDKGRIAARSGIGALMGSKKLKMLVLKGDKQIQLANKEDLVRVVSEYNSKKKTEPGKFMKAILKMAPGMPKLLRRFNISLKGPPKMITQVYHIFGTSVANTISAEVGDSPVKNWSGIGQFDFPPDKSKELSTVIINSYKQKDYGCLTCPVQCGGVLKVPELGIDETYLPEYETCCAFGTLLLNNDLMSIIILNELCNRAGIDTISTGVTVAFAIECFENGIITTDDTNGLELRWGKSDSIVELVKMIINREGIGDILADGCKKASEKIGTGSQKFAMHSLGQEIAMHDPKYFESLGYSYAYDPTPGRHTAASIDFMDIGPIGKFMKGFSLPKKWKKNKKSKYKGQMMVTGIRQFIDCLGLCMFATLFGNYPVREIIRSVTGWDLSVEEIIKTGLRIQTLRQSFTIREGVKIAQNDLPSRVIGDPPFEKGPNKGVTVNYRDFYKGVCKEMGWNPENGYPLRETLRELNLDYVIKDIY